MTPCVYLGPAIEGQQAEGHQLYVCRQFQRCTLPRINDVPGCEGCRKYLSPDSPKLAAKWQDPLLVLDRHRQASDAVRSLLAGRSAFLACGGPSAKELPLESLARRGAWTMAVNNVAGSDRFRPQAMVCSDPPQKFSHSVWRDPGIMKFLPIPKLKKKGKGILRKKEDGRFSRIEGGTISVPNVWGFERRSWMKPDATFFTEESAAWGNHNDGVAETGEEKTVCTMLLAMRLMYYLGARRIFLLGVDFWMAPTYGYSFAQTRSAAAAASNNDQFRVVNNWLCKMQTEGVFKRYGLEIYNCNDKSGLRAFQYVPFADALEDVCAGVEQVPDLADWYEPACPSCGIPWDDTLCTACGHANKKKTQ